MSCLDNFISINGFCGDSQTTSISGLDLFDAPEISAKTLANTANADYVSGKALATAKLTTAKTLIKNDLISAMGANNIVPQIADQRMTCGTFKPSTTIEASELERGVTLFKNPDIKGNLRKLKIHTIKIYPLADAASVTVKIYDDYAGGLVSEYDFEFVANETNEFDVDYTVQGTYARVVVSGADIEFASSYLTMCAGCNGSMPNDCGYTKSSYDGTDTNSKEGYGVLLTFSCVCDYDELLCSLARTFIGELVWLKTRVLIQEERLHSDRMNNYIVYGTSDAKETKAELEAQYINKWNAFINSMPQLLKTFKDDCLLCNGNRWVNNV